MVHLQLEWTSRFGAKGSMPQKGVLRQPERLFL
jgi:hypothetical protein